MSEAKYLNFPIKLINGLFTDKDETMTNILYCGLYSHSLKLDLGETDFDNFLSSVKFYNVSMSGTQTDIKRKFKIGQDLYNSYGTSPMVGMNMPIFWDFYKNDKSDFEIACLAAFLGIKSILGVKPYCKITNAYLWARMNGISKAVEDVSMLSESIQKYANEYQTVKIKNELRENWGLVTYSRFTRGFYVSYTLDLEALIFEAEKKRKSTKDKQYKQNEKETLLKVLARLNK
jgi:hypothetical protein